MLVLSFSTQHTLCFGTIPVQRQQLIIKSGLLSLLARLTRSRAVYRLTLLEFPLSALQRG